MFGLNIFKMKKLEKAFFPFFAGLLLNLGLFAGGSDTLSVIELSEIRLVQHRGAFYGEDHHVFFLGKEELKLNAGLGLSDILSGRFPASIKTYGGTGNLATVSLRGTRSVHTQVSWNGFPINSGTTGDADLSLLPLIIIDRISIINGASGSLYGSGTFGGAIDISSETNFNQKMGVSYNISTGSFNDRFHALNLTVGNRLVQYRNGVYFRRADNDFTYVDPLFPGSPEKKMLHNEL